MRKKSPEVWLAMEVDADLAVGQVEAFNKYEGGWIATSRSALGWPASELAAKLNVSQQALSQLEVRERSGHLSVRKLRVVAGAMDCRLVYGFIPVQPMTEVAADLFERQEEARRRHRTMPRPI